MVCESKRKVGFTGTLETQTQLKIERFDPKYPLAYAKLAYSSGKWEL